MSLSSLPLSYCTNVHPGRSVAEVEWGLDGYTLPVRRAVAQPLAAGLWLAKPVVDELLATPDALPAFAAALERRGLTCHTLNAFPFGDFHSARVKENVYLPDWTDPRRLEYTIKCATVLSHLLPAAADGSISTLPLGFKAFLHAPAFTDVCIARLIECARALARIHDSTGKTIRLAIEPEPLCLLETTAEAVSFFERLWQTAERERASRVVREHLGVCYDVCHQAVEFEDAAIAVRALTSAGVRINKVHISCALELDHPADNPEGRAALRRYAEPRYLHQVIARTPDGRLFRATDLSPSLLDSPPSEWRDAITWRIHFHVPVDAEHLGPLKTTRSDLKHALAAVAALDYAPHLEVETYTWEVLPNGAADSDLVTGLTREMTATAALLAELRR